jgi:phage terminase large subunit-like protein
VTTIAVSAPARRTRAPRPFTRPHFRAWAARHTLDNDEPWIIEPYFDRFVADVFAGFSVCWLVVPEGNAKTTSVAGLALYVIEHKPSAYVPVAASARDQAEWIYRQAEGFVHRSDRRDTFKCLEGYRRIRCDAMNSRIQVFAADERSGDGIIPGGIAVLDELHRHRDLKLYNTWSGKLDKRDAQLVVISTAGEVGGEFEEERERLRQVATKITRRGRCYVRAEHRVDSRKLAVLHDYAVPEDGDIEDIRLVKQANPFSGVTYTALKEKRARTASVQHWTRFTGNRASRSEHAAITEAEWHAAATAPEIPKEQPIWLGLDVAWKWDTTAMVPLWTKAEHELVLGPAKVLVPPRDSSSMDPLLAELALSEIHARNPIHTCVMDTTRAEQLAEWIAKELGALVIAHGQGNEQAAEDYERFMQALRLGWLTHRGDRDLTQHALNAIVRITGRDKARFDRTNRSRRDGSQDVRVIDALDAAAGVVCESFKAAPKSPARLVSW